MDVDSGAGAGAGAGGGAGFDEELYNRQLYVMGKDAQARMSSSAVLIAGLKGSGIEIAKNLALMGVKSITLADEEPTTAADLSAQFYLREADIGKSRAAACKARLAELNRYVPISDLADSGLSLMEAASSGDYAVVVVNDVPLDVALQVNAAARAAGTAFVGTETRGAFARLFNDFGDAFDVEDQTGEPPVQCMVEGITSGDPGTVTVRDDARHGFEEGTLVTFTEVQGMTELNDAEPIRVTPTGPFTFTIGDTRKFGEYTMGGYVTEVKQPRRMVFKSLKEALAAPEFTFNDFGKMERSPQLHIAFVALDRFVGVKHRMPRPGSSADAEEMVGLAKAAGVELKQEIGDADAFAVVVRLLARCAAGQLAPVSAVVGGIAAQEALKACSGKFTPIAQFMYLDFGEIVPDAGPESEFAPEKGASVQASGRYDGQVAVVGRTIQKKIEGLRYFLVGAGAIGCEMLKNWACMGVACGEGGKVTVTDMDSIEKSNLSRQFLFRPSDVKKPKSTCAVAATKGMNPSFNGVAMELRVGPDTEDVFDEDFWNGLSGVCTALDNVQARLYVDQHCVTSKKPLLESGTLGTKGNTQVVVPYLTENYGASQDPPEKDIPICTLKHFPNKIEHTLQWARDWFEGEFKQAAESVNAYLSDPHYLRNLEAQANSRVTTLETLHDCLVKNRASSLEDCVAWARLKFEALYNAEIQQLLHTFPVDSVTREGTPFWSGPKRAPAPVEFDVADPVHMAYLMASANMRATMFGLDTSADPAWFAEVVAKVDVPKFKPKEGVKIPADEAEAKKLEDAGKGSGAAASGGAFDAEAHAETLGKELPDPSTLGAWRMTEIDFDKDIDAHMECVTAASNLRARNYRIEEQDKHESRRIAGKIIPAIATTTAMVAGLISIELYKLLLERPLEAYRSCFANLAIPTFVFSEPVGVKTTRLELPPETEGGEPRVWNWSLWDTVDIDGPLTMKEFIEVFEKRFGLSVSMLSLGVKMAYSFFMKKDKIAKRMAMSMTELAEELTGEKVAPGVTFLQFEPLCSNADGDDVDLPPVRYRLSAAEQTPATAGGAGAGDSAMS